MAISYEDIRKVSEKGGYKPAEWAAYSRNPEMVKLVKEAGDDFNVADDFGYTPAHEVVSSGDLEMVRAVYEAGGDFTVSDKNGQTPEDLAAESGNPEMVKLVEEIVAKQREEKARAAQSARPVDVYLSKEGEREAERAKIRAATENSIAEHDPMPELGKEGGASKSSTESQESPDDPAR